MQAGIDSNFQFQGDRSGEIALNARGNVSVDHATIANLGIGIGNAGNINIAGRSVFFTNGSQLLSNNQRQGSAGTIAINAHDTASFDGVSSSGEATTLAANLNSTGTGNGGKIAIDAKSVFLSKLPLMHKEMEVISKFMSILSTSLMADRFSLPVAMVAMLAIF